MSKNEMNKKGFNLKGLANTLKNQFDKEDDLYDDMYEDEYIQQNSNEAQNNNEKIQVRRTKSADKTLHIFRPKNKEEDVAEIITQLRDGSPCIVNVSEIADEEAKRIIDNISGAAFALMGSGVPIAKGIYAFVPKSFMVSDNNTKQSLEQKDYIMM